jgi:hypothetical protein
MGSSPNSIHVPRVWEITGKAPEDRRRDVREWNNTFLGKIPFEPSVGSAKRSRQKKPSSSPLNKTVLREQHRPRRWQDYNPSPRPT